MRFSGVGYAPRFSRLGDIDIRSILLQNATTDSPQATNNVHLDVTVENDDGPHTGPATSTGKRAAVNSIHSRASLASLHGATGNVERLPLFTNF